MKRVADASSNPLLDFGGRVRARREAIGDSQETLAMRCGLHRTYVGSIERGERNVALLNILRLAAGLDCDPSQLVTGLAP